MSTVITLETLVLPDGMEEGDVNAVAWGVKVRWRGVQNETATLGGYSVEHLGRQLSRAHKWSHGVRPFQYRQYRWSTHDQALSAAKAVVNRVVVNGRTWAEAGEVSA